MEIKEELVRVITKDGATYVLGAPLPQPVGQDPEPVTVIYIALLYGLEDGGDDVFRIICKADPGSHYEREGLMVITSIPYSEATRWDAVANEPETMQAINDYRLGAEEDDAETETEADTDSESEESESDANNNPIAGDKDEQSKGIETNKVR